MSGFCGYGKCDLNDNYSCVINPIYCPYRAHKPEPNESVSPSRTSGSPTALRADSVEATASQLAPVLRPGSSLVHPESVCSACGGPNITWTTESELWNKCNGSPNGILCPICFVRLAEKQGFDKCWRLIPV